MAHMSVRWRVVLLVVATALAVRVVYLLESRSSPFFDAPVVDAKTFCDDARRIAAGDWRGGPEPFWQPPLYTYFLALHYLLFPHSFFLAARLTQIVLGTASCALACGLAGRVAGSGVALLVGLTAALYGPLVHYDAELLAVPLEVVLDLSLLWLVCQAAERPTTRRWALAGVAAGLAALTRPNVLLFVAALGLWLAWRDRGPQAPPLRTRVRPWIAALLCLAAVVLPVTARNWLVGHDVVLISHNAGVNFYIGNNARYDSTVAIHPGRQWEMLVAEPSLAGQGRPSERSAYFLRKGLAYIADAPLDWLGLTARKTWIFWSGVEGKRNQDIYYARLHSLVLRCLLWDRWLSFPFGLIAPLGLLGLAVTWRQRTVTLAVLRLWVLAYSASVVLFFVADRYRLPVVPALLVFAGLGLADLAHAWQHGRRALVWRAPVLAGLVVTLNLSAAPPLWRDAQLEHDLGEVYLRQGDLSQSMAHSRRALELEPDYDSAMHNLALALMRSGQPQQAAVEARRALQVHPKRSDTHMLLAQALAAQGEAGAEEELRAALRLDPRNLGAHYQYGHLLVSQGRYAEALEHLQRTLGWEEADYWVLYDLARALQGTGQLGEASSRYAQAEAMDPTRPEAAVAMGAVCLLQGRVDLARQHLGRALQRDPGNPQALANLGFADLRQGRPQDAVRHLLDAVPRAPDRRMIYRALADAYRAMGQEDRARAVLDSLRRL